MRSINSVKTRSARWVTALAVTALIGAFVAPAASGRDVEPLRDIERDAASLRDRIDLPPDPDRDVADTAIVITNLANRRGVACCVAFDYEGKPAGRGRVRVPPRGLRWLLASDISNDVDFVGSAQCFLSGEMLGSAIFLGRGITDLPVHQRAVGRANRIAIPVVAHY